MAEKALSISPSRSQFYEFQLRECVHELYLSQEVSDIKFVFVRKETALVHQTTDQTIDPTIDPTNDTTTEIIDTIPAHKAILVSGSKVFRAMFNESWKEKNQVEIVDASCVAFKEFLQCFYLNSVSFTMENISQVMYLASKYIVDGFLTICSRFLIDNMTLDDVHWCYELAILYEQSDLRQLCESFILRNAEIVYTAPDFLDFDRISLAEMLKLNHNFKETMIFKNCMNWAKNACKENDLDENNIDNLRTQLGNCLYLIRFNSMTLDELNQCVKQYAGLLRNDEYADAVQCINVKGYKSKMFNQRLRFNWDSKKVLAYRPNHSTQVKYLQNVETLKISTNKRILLGAINVCQMYSYQHGAFICSDVPINIACFAQGITSIEQVIFSGSMKFDDQMDAFIQFPEPILIEPNDICTISLVFNDSHANCTLLNCFKQCEEITLANDLKIRLYNDCDIHLISCLKFNDLQIQ